VHDKECYKYFRYERLVLMKLKDLFYTDIEPSLNSEFKISMLNDNVRRIKIYSVLVIFFELILALSDVTTSLLKVDNRFHFSYYLIAYITMILVNIIFAIYINRIGDIKDRSEKYLNRLENSILGYFTFILCWGSIISLLDQRLYGQLMVFMVNMITFSVLFYIDSKKILLPYISSTLIIMIGLPFFQHSSDVLIGHYINLTVFILIALVSSRIVFYNYCNDFKNKMLLSEANKRLHELSFFDELTCIPNRRSLNNYIEAKYEHDFKNGLKVAAIMIDIDSFKQFNDSYGHFSGDEILIKVAEKINEMAAEKKHFAARIGGEEFIYVAEGVSVEQLMEIAETIRSNVLNLKIPHDYSEYSYLTISLGVSTLTLNSEKDIFKCIEYADNALYDAKMNGRNCVKLRL
jgi:diguanylate cyclase (GGDEF)-like protein